MTKKTSPAYRASKEETIPINKLHPFSNHPFHIRHDLEFSELVDSISESGIITPIIVRPKVGVGYEVISGHRRWEACKELGIESIPARVEYIDDDEATILMVNSNIQREHVLPSEKAFAYKMRMEAMKHQGKATSSQLGTKLRTLDQHTESIVSAAIHAVLPDVAVVRALQGYRFGTGKIVLVAAGKAAWQMANAASDCLGDRIADGVVVTKYGHIKGPIAHIRCFEGGHPVPDDGSCRGTQAALDLVQGLTAQDTVVFLLSGGGSALLEKPLIPLDELQDITQQLLGCGADIVEINTIRKRLSAVKGGRFAMACAPAQVLCVVLSDVLGDPLDMIASGPACADSSTCRDAENVVKKYGIQLSADALACLRKETPKQIDNVTTRITGSVRELCAAAADAAQALGYTPILLTDQLACQAREAGLFLAEIARTHQHPDKPMAFIAGGETVVKIIGNGKGGRNQELALAAAPGISGCNAAVFSVGSDGTDGPTDAAGGYVDGDTLTTLRAAQIDPVDFLNQNDSYTALQAAKGLLFTGPTGTNVNDVAVVLIR